MSSSPREVAHRRVFLLGDEAGDVLDRYEPKLVARAHGDARARAARAFGDARELRARGAPRPLESLLQPVRPHRFQEVTGRLRVEGGQRVLFEGRREDDRGRLGHAREVMRGLEPVHARHADVEQHDFGPQPAREQQGLFAARGDAGELHRRQLLDEVGEPLAGERLVVDDQHAQVHAPRTAGGKSQRHDESLGRLDHLDLGFAVEHELEPLAHVVEPDPVAGPAADDAGRHGVVDRQDGPRAFPLAAHADRPALVERLDAVVDGIFEQRLQDERRDRRVHRQAVDLPVDLQPLPEAQPLDALVGARDLDLMRKRDAFAVLAQRCAEQVREVGDRLFRHLRVAARERGDGVHAVEQEMRADARLQRPHAALRLGLDVGLPLVRDIEVAKREPGRDRAHGEILQLHAQVIRASRGAPGAGGPGRVVRDPPGAFGHERGDRERKGDRKRRARAHVQSRQQAARRAPGGRRAERGPQQERAKPGQGRSRTRARCRGARA